MLVELVGLVVVAAVAALIEVPLAVFWPVLVALVILLIIAVRRLIRELKNK